ncbi:MAG: hypothetical protein R3A49_12315 [Acidimicrobiia bacterium]
MSDREHGTEDRLRDALQAKAQADDISTDAWAKIRGGVNEKARRRRTAVWTSLGLAGAAAAVIAIVSFAALSGGDNNPTVAERQNELEPGFVALTVDGKLRRFSPAGDDLGLITDTSWTPEASFSRPEFSVAPDGTVFLSRAVTDDECSRSEQLGAEIVSVSLEGGEPEVVVPVGTAPSVSPDGSQLAFITTRSGEQCDSGVGAQDEKQPAPRTVALLDLESGEQALLDIAYPDPMATFSPDRDPSGGFNPEGPVAWSPDGTELATNIRCTIPDSDCDNQAVRISMPASGGAANLLGIWGEGQGGPSVAFSDDTSVLIDYGETINGDWIGLVSSAGWDPVRSSNSNTMIPEFIGLPHNAQLLSLSTLPGENAPGVLVTTAPDRGAPTGTTAIYSAGQESTPRVVAENVMAAVWVPGTTFEDLDAETSTPDAVADEPTAVAVEEIPLDGSYLPGIGRTDLMAADESGVWVAIADDAAAAATRVVHVSAATETVDDEAETPDDVQGLLLADGDLWWTSPTTMGRSGSTGFEAASSQGTTSSQGFSGILEATDSAVWTTTADRRALVSVARQGSSRTPSSDNDLSVHPLSAPVQQIVALGDDLWVETDADPKALYRFDTDSGELVDGVDLPDRNAVTYAVADGTIWTIDTRGNLVPLVGKHAGEDPLATGIPTGRFVPTDGGLAISGADDRQLRRYDEGLSPIGSILELPTPDRGDLDGPWGGMVIAGPDAWWQNAVGPSILRVHLDG